MLTIYDKIRIFAAKTKYSKSYLVFGIQSQQLLIIDKIQFDTYFLVVITDTSKSINLYNYTCNINLNFNRSFNFMFSLKNDFN